MAGTKDPVKFAREWNAQVETLNGLLWTIGENPKLAVRLKKAINELHEIVAEAAKGVE